MSTRFFTPVTLLHCASIIIGAVVLGLATVNFGVLSIWINATASSLTLFYHITILFLNWRQSRRAMHSVSQHKTLILPKCHDKILSDIKMPTAPSPTYAPPPYDVEKLSPNRRPISRLAIPGMGTTKGSEIPYKPFYSLASFLFIILCTIITVIGFGMTVELSIHGAKFLLPAERAKGMTFPWNIKVQKAQCTFLGVLTLLSLTVLVACAVGRAEISRAEDEKREEAEYGFASPEVCLSTLSFKRRSLIISRH
ncbi:hypothetical protein AN958_04366 [Leucoagaricus sp. SymC.cos]|nr:hypothetical protein AN958_04366 [Leucoagaricus sp. SymC.cos]